MSRLPQHTWVGESGEQYAYFVREWPTRLVAVAGNFIFVRVESSDDWRPIFIGECTDLSTIAGSNLARWSLDRHSVTHVHTRPNLNSAPGRRREVADLVAHWKPPANRLPP